MKISDYQTVLNLAEGRGFFNCEVQTLPVGGVRVGFKTKPGGQVWFDDKQQAINHVLEVTNGL